MLSKIFNKKLIIGYLLGLLSALSISVFAVINYNAKDIKYIKNNNETINLDNALNELYNKLDNRYDLSKLELLWAPGKKFIHIY